MSTKKNIKRNELAADYKMLDKMSKDLALHQKNIRQVNRAIVKHVDADFREGLVERLDVAVLHMRKALKEVQEAKRELKAI